MSMFSFLRSSSSSSVNAVSSPAPAISQPETKDVQAESESGGFFSLHEISSSNVHTKTDLAAVVDVGGSTSALFGGMDVAAVVDGSGSSSALFGGMDVAAVVDGSGSSSALFGGMDLKAKTEEFNHQSSFGFLQNNVSERDYNSTTAFSFMQSGQTSTGTSLDTVHEKRSSFSFLDLSEQSDFISTSNNNNESISSDKVGGEPNGSNIEILKTSAEDGVIKLGKTSATKAVKKKRRATRVGFGRTDDADVEGADEDVASALPEVHIQQPREPVDDEENDTMQSTQHTTQHALPPEDEYQREVEVELEKPQVVDPVEAEEDVGNEQAIDERDHTSEYVEPTEYESSEAVSIILQVSEEQTISTQQSRERLISFQDTYDVPTQVYQPHNHFPIYDHAADIGLVVTNSENEKASPVTTVSPEESPADGFSFLLGNTVETHTTTESKFLPLTTESQIQSNLDPVIAVPAVSLQYSSTADQLLQESTVRLISLDRAFREQDDFQRHSLNEANEIRRGLLEEARLRESGAARLAELEAEQTKLALLEEFEKADQLSVDMDSLREQIQGGAARVAHLLARQSALEKKFHEKSLGHAREARQAAEGLHAWHKLLRDEFRRGEKEKGSSLAAEKALLAAEQERLQLEQNQCRREEEAVNAELLVTEEAIAGQSAELRNRRAETEVALDTVREDIRRIEELLQARKAEEARLNKELITVESRLGEVRRKYDRQLQRLQDRKETLRTTQSECTQEEAELRIQQSAYDDRVNETRQNIRTMKRRNAEIRIDEKIVNAIFTVLTTTSSDIKDDDEQGTPQWTSLLQLLAREDGLHGLAPQEDTAVPTTTEAAAVFEAERQLQTANQAEDDIKQQLNSLHTEIKLLLDNVLPQKEAEKKAHAASKRFKDAAVVAKEIKELQSRKEELDQQASQLADVLINAAQECGQCQQRLRVCQGALKEAVLKRDVQRAELLTLRANQLHSCLGAVGRLQEQLQKLATSEEQGRGDSSSGMKSAVAFVEYELQVILSELNELQQKHPGVLTPYNYVEEAIDPVIDEDSDNEDEDDDDEEKNELAVRSIVEYSADNDNFDGSISKDPDSYEGEGGGNSLILVGDSSEGDVAVTGDGNNGATSAEKAVEAAEGEDSIAEANVDEEEVIKAESEARNQKIQQAKEIFILVESMSKEMEAAAESEDFDQAALLDENISVKNQELDLLLSELGCERMDISNFCEEEA